MMHISSQRNNTGLLTHTFFPVYKTAICLMLEILGNSYSLSSLKLHVILLPLVNLGVPVFLVKKLYVDAYK